MASSSYLLCCAIFISVTFLLSVECTGKRPSSKTLLDRHGQPIVRKDRKTVADSKTLRRSWFNIAQRDAAEISGQDNTTTAAGPPAEAPAKLSPPGSASFEPKSSLIVSSLDNHGLQSLRPQFNQSNQVPQNATEYPKVDNQTGKSELNQTQCNGTSSTGGINCTDGNSNSTGKSPANSASSFEPRSSLIVTTLDNHGLQSWKPEVNLVMSNESNSTNDATESTTIFSTDSTIPSSTSEHAKATIEFFQKAHSQLKLLLPQSLFVSSSGQAHQCEHNSDCYGLREPSEWCPMPINDKFYDKGCFCEQKLLKCVIERQSGSSSQYTDCAKWSETYCSTGRRSEKTKSTASTNDNTTLSSFPATSSSSTETESSIQQSTTSTISVSGSTLLSESVTISANATTNVTSSTGVPEFTLLPLEHITPNDTAHSGQTGQTTQNGSVSAVVVDNTTTQLTIDSNGTQTTSLGSTGSTQSTIPGSITTTGISGSTQQDNLTHSDSISTSPSTIQTGSTISSARETNSTEDGTVTSNEATSSQTIQVPSQSTISTETRASSETTSTQFSTQVPSGSSTASGTEGGSPTTLSINSTQINATDVMLVTITPSASTVAGQRRRLLRKYRWI